MNFTVRFKEDKPSLVCIALVTKNLSGLLCRLPTGKISYGLSLNALMLLLEDDTDINIRKR
jgi:hypothetical protein